MRHKEERLSGSTDLENYESNTYCITVEKIADARLPIECVHNY